jgi:purine-cytosine permease-like protein
VARVRVGQGMAGQNCCVVLMVNIVMHICVNFYSRTVHLDTIKVLLSTDAQEFCFKRKIKISIKTTSTCFGVITIIRERAIYVLLKLLVLKQSVRIIS